MARGDYVVEVETNVYDADGVTVIGRLKPGVFVDAERVDEHWFRLRSAGGHDGFVAAEAVQPVGRTHGATPGGPGQRSRRRWLVSGAVAALLAALAIAAFTLLSDGGDEELSRIVIDRAMARDLDDVVAPGADAPYALQSLPAGLSCDAPAPGADVDTYDGVFDSFDLMGGLSSSAEVVCNSLRVEVSGGRVTALHGFLVVEGFASVQIADGGLVVATACLSDVANVFSLASPPAGDELIVRIDVVQTAGRRASPDFDCDYGGWSYSKTWSASIVIGDGAAVIDFVDPTDGPVASVVLD